MFLSVDSRIRALFRVSAAGRWACPTSPAGAVCEYGSRQAACQEKRREQQQHDLFHGDTPLKWGGSPSSVAAARGYLREFRSVFEVRIPERK